MANPLTGDFDAVLQISGATINRLVAGMHQNTFTKPDLPSFPHSVQLRIGDDFALDKVRGTAHVQIGAPRVQLIHGATDRFILEVDVRGRYMADGATEPLPMFIHGTVRAEYRIQDIDKSCLGWRQKAADFLWVRVVRDSVRFEGSAEDDVSPLEFATAVASDTSATHAANVAKITRQIAWLLASRFEATPHPIKSSRFKRGSMRSINNPLTGSAVATPIGLNGEDPAGDIASLNNTILEDSDFGVAVSVGYIMSLVEPVLAPIRTFSKSVPAANTVYRVRMNPPTAEWQPHTSSATIKIKVSGSAKTDAVYADATFDVDQDILLYFDGGDGRLKLVAGARRVSAHADGLGSSIVAQLVYYAVEREVKAIVDGACTSAQPTLDAMTDKIVLLQDQLRNLDDQAQVYLDLGLFLRDGMILRGTIMLASRKRPVVKFEKTAEQDGHTALQSWIPGGRIDRFDWSWTWNGSEPPGKATYEHRFILCRPRAPAGRWGMGIGLTSPLPGIDGWGTVCLSIHGVQTDSATGALVPIEVQKKCTRFGLSLSDTVRNGGRLYVLDEPELSKDVPFPQLAFSAVRGTGDHTVTPNTLVIFAAREWDDHTAETLRHGLEGSGRYDAGLSLIVLFREGTLARGGRELMARVEETGRRLGLATFVNEDVQQSWSRALAVDPHQGGPAWRLLSPDGTVAWQHGGGLSSDSLTAALDVNLRRSGDARPLLTKPGLEIGDQVSGGALVAGWEPSEARCPPPPLGRAGIMGSVVTFVQKGSAASSVQIRELFAQHGQREGDAPLLVMVVDGADAREADALQHELGVDVVTVPDPTGTITDRFGIAVWPTTVTLDQEGIVSDVATGVTSAERRSYPHQQRASYPDHSPGGPKSAL